MLRRMVMLQAGLIASALAADLPIREVILYKHGVGYFQRTGDLKPGESARLDFKAEDMNDVLKSLTVTDRNGGKVASVRYDASEPLEKRLEDFPFLTGNELSMAAFLDRMKGSRLELKVGTESVAGSIVSARLIRSNDKHKTAERETAGLLLSSGEMRAFDLAAA